MPDRHYIETRAFQEEAGTVEVEVRLKEMPDGTHAPAMYDAVNEAALIRIEAKLDVLIGLIDGGALKVKLV